MGRADDPERGSRARSRARRAGLRPAGEGEPRAAAPAPTNLRQFPQPVAPPPPAEPCRLVTGRPPPVPDPLPPRYQLLVTLVGIVPPIWRRLLVPGDTTLATLHRVLQVALGWQGYHLWQFVLAEQYYGDPTLLEAEPLALPTGDARATTLQQLAPWPGVAFRYEYDFGDDWRHDVTVEALLSGTTTGRRFTCLAGARAAPPEDCGGVPGYAALLATLRQGRGSAYRDLVAWLGGPFDPEACDLAKINRRLPRVR